MFLFKLIVFLTALTVIVEKVYLYLDKYFEKRDKIIIDKILKERENKHEI